MRVLIADECIIHAARLEYQERHLVGKSFSGRIQVGLSGNSSHAPPPQTSGKLEILSRSALVLYCVYHTCPLTRQQANSVYKNADFALKSPRNRTAFIWRGPDSLKLYQPRVAAFWISYPLLSFKRTNIHHVGNRYVSTAILFAFARLTSFFLFLFPFIALLDPPDPSMCCCKTRCRHNQAGYSFSLSWWLQDCCSRWSSSYVPHDRDRCSFNADCGHPDHHVLWFGMWLHQPHRPVQ